MIIKEASVKWGISERRIRKLVKEGRISGAKKVGTTWIIPDDSIKPSDKRFKSETIDIIVDLSDNYFDEIDSKLKILKEKKISKAALKLLRENNILNWTYNSNAIEGNTLTLRETKVVLEGITIGGKSVEEHLEIINHKEAIEYLEQLIGDKTLTEWDIKNIHKLILKEIDNENAGRYRSENVKIAGAKHKPIDHLFIHETMEKLIKNFNSWNYHPIIRAGLLHGEFVKIHPFIDGNGRTARLLMNFEVMKNDYLPIIIKKENRLKYYECLDNAHITGDYTEFIKLITELESEMLDEYLSVLD